MVNDYPGRLDQTIFVQPSQSPSTPGKGHFRQSFESNPKQSYHELTDMSNRSSSVSLLGQEEQKTKPGFATLVSKLTLSEWLQQRYSISGWQVGVLGCAGVSGLVCLLNIILTLWAISNHHITNGLSDLYSGSCSEVSRISLWVHLGINALSSILLSASNYTMQIISSPTRKEVDLAHQQSRWLDIGVPSIRNLRGISRQRLFMWGILALSSVPLHLMYNTAVFSTLNANNYVHMVVAEPMLSANMTTGQNTTLYTQFFSTMRQNIDQGRVHNYTSVKCMKAYASNLVSKTRNLLLITRDNTGPEINYTDIRTESSSDRIPYSWICGGDDWSRNPIETETPVCRLSTALTTVDTWNVDGRLISYCMVEEVEEKCKLSFSVGIMIVVIVANATKSAIMIFTFLRLKGPTLVTIGDAVASFLEIPDPTTAGLCLSTRKSIKKESLGQARNSNSTQWFPKRHLWYHAASKTRWLSCNILCAIYIGLGILAFISGTSTSAMANLKDLYELGFGRVTAFSIIENSPKSLFATILVANMPQGILSFLYLLYNGMFSSVLGAYEWSLFGKHRQPLRVTSPKGQQRSTFFLHLPYRYAIPLLILSGGLHWGVSQSLFLARVTFTEIDGEVAYSPLPISALGFSCIGIFFSILLGTVAILVGILIGFQKYDSGIPIVGNCSAAISAACHRPHDDTSAFLLPLQWGVVGDTVGGVGHCCLTSFDVTPPEPGRFYAGVWEKID